MLEKIRVPRLHGGRPRIGRTGSSGTRTLAIVADLDPWTGRGVYVNILNFDELARVVEALGGPEKYAELGRLKAPAR